MTPEEYEAEVSRLRHEAETRKQGERFMPQQFQVNKYIRMALSFLIGVLGVAIFFADSIDWTKLGLSPERAGGIVAVIGALKFFYNSFAPSSMKATIPTGNTVITQKATKLTWGDIIAQLLTAAVMIAGVFVFAVIWAGNGEMK
jgi:hypothetical protein